MVLYIATHMLWPFSDLFHIPICVIIPDSSTRALCQIPSETPSSRAGRNLKRNICQFCQPSIPVIFCRDHAVKSYNVAPLALLPLWRKLCFAFLMPSKSIILFQVWTRTPWSPVASMIATIPLRMTIHVGVILGSGAVWFHKTMPTFPRNMLSPSSVLKWQSWEVKALYRVWGRKAEGRGPIREGYRKKIQTSREPWCL
jgi:hypothetical protein